jgi:16S rRNA processing protein RimM
MPPLEVGRIAKPHGVRGEVVVELVTDRLERLAPGAVLEDRTGRPFTVEASRPHQGRFIVRFAGVDDRSGAEGVRGTVLFAEPVADPDELFVHELIGASVVTAEGDAIGIIAGVEANPASDLLVLDSGVLVPAVFIVERDAGGRIVVDLPDGLLEL